MSAKFFVAKSRLGGVTRFVCRSDRPESEIWEIAGFIIESSTGRPLDSGIERITASSVSVIPEAKVSDFIRQFGEIVA